MQFHCTLIIRTSRGMAAASSWGPILCNFLRQNQPTSVLVNLQITRLCFRPILPNTFTFSSATATTNSARRWANEAQTVCSDADKRMIKCNNEYNEDARFLAKTTWTVRPGNSPYAVKGSSEHSDVEGSREIAKYPRPQGVPWQKELANRVHFIGRIGGPVQLKRTISGKSFASTTLGVRGGSQQQTMWFNLVFWNELAETAAQHLKKYDSVYVSGFLCLQTTAGEDNKLQRYQVVALTINFIEKTSPAFPSSSSKKAREDAAIIESLWEAFFINPCEWWDNRTNKRNPRSPDFKHKDTGEVLWIQNTSNPSWVKSQLAVLDSRMKVLEEWGKVGSSARSQGS